MEILILLLAVIIGGTIIYGVVQRNKLREEQNKSSEAPISETKTEAVEPAIVSEPAPVIEKPIKVKKPRKPRTPKTEKKVAKKSVKKVIRKSKTA